MSNPTADWERVGDRFYRKIKIYDAVFDQDLELENYVIAGAPCAGAIGSFWCDCHLKAEADDSVALYRDEEKLHTYRGSQASKSGIDIYSCAGKLIRRINVGHTCSWIGALYVAATDVYSGTKAQYVD